MRKFLCYFALVCLTGTSLLACGGSEETSEKEANPPTAKDAQIQDITLKGFMLAGVYFVQGYGGAEQFETKLKSLINQDQSQAPFLTMLDSAYRKAMIFPFGRSATEKVDARSTLAGWFQITNQHDFFLFLNSLKDSGFQAHYDVCKTVLDSHGGKNADLASIDLKASNLPEGSEVLLGFVKDNYDRFTSAGIKAWDIGLFVYIVNLGYSAEYIDPTNAKALIMDQLKVAEEKYDDWKSYFSDFMLGREFSGVAKDQNEVYRAAIEGMLQGHYSMYTYMPL